MDPVSRRLAAAAMGVVFGLSRDEELEATRLDLERARMEREDFRNGAGPDTAFMHYDMGPFPAMYETCYRERMKAGHTMRKNVEVRLKEQNETAADLIEARSLLAKVVRGNMLKKRTLSQTTANRIVEYFSNAQFDDDDVEGYAGDGLGEIEIGTSDSTDEETETDPLFVARRRISSSM